MRKTDGRAEASEGSLRAALETLSNGRRSHWQIADGLQDVRDVTLGEGACQAR
jgi:hypothetical protein